MYDPYDDPFFFDEEYEEGLEPPDDWEREHLEAEEATGFEEEAITAPIPDYD